MSKAFRALFWRMPSVGGVLTGSRLITARGAQVRAASNPFGPYGSSLCLEARGHQFVDQRAIHR